jgi:hypothetical protein
METGDIEIIYKPTKEMIADMMTKPLTGALFGQHSRKLSGSICAGATDSIIK